jgi:hypothetical protein
MRKKFDERGINIVDFVWKTLDIIAETPNFDSFKKINPIGDE